MSRNDEGSRRNRKASNKEEKRELPEVVQFFILFTQVYPALVLLMYVSGFMDVQLSKLSSDSMSAGLDVVLLTIAALCALVGPGASIFAVKYLEK